MIFFPHLITNEDLCVQKVDVRGGRDVILQWKQTKVWFMIVPPKRVFLFGVLCMIEQNNIHSSFLYF